VTGRTGTGKTCAALALMDRVPCSVYVTAERLADDAYARGATIWAVAREALLVVVDEVAARGQESDRAYLAIKAMADLRESRPVIWISNQGHEGIRHVYDDRVFSRLCSGTVVELIGEDRRFRD